MSHRNNSLLISLVLFMIFGFACGDEPLKDLDRYQIIQHKTINTNVDFCTIKPDKIKSHLKYIFIIDKSGSNQDLTNTLGTDPTGERRYAPLQLYLEEAPQDETIFYSLINLSTNAEVVSGFTNDKERFLEIVDHEANPNEVIPPAPSDGGWTNFSASISSTRDIIAADIELAKSGNDDILLAKSLNIISSNYVIIFVSDGAPWVGTTTLQNKSDILDQVEGILSLEDENKEYVDSIQIHTGYYYNQDGFDIDAHTYMKEMAEKGQGNAFEFGAGQVIDFNRFSVPERNVKHTLRDIIVTNVNTKWDNDLLTVDQDGDGLVDVLENELGSNAENRDSDGNGISDGVEYYTTGAPCAALKCKTVNQEPCKKYICDPQGAHPYPGCSKWEITRERCNAYCTLKIEACVEECIEEKSQEVCDEECTCSCDYLNERREDGVNIRWIFDRDNDYLNNCEESIVMKSKLDNFDSNQNWMPDNLSFRSNLSFIEGTHGDASLDPDWDDESNYNEIKTNTPIRYDNNKIYGLKPYRYNLTVVSDDHAQTCFELEVKGISLGTTRDLIRVYIMENTTMVKNKRFMRSAQKYVDPEESVINFTDQDFQ